MNCSICKAIAVPYCSTIVLGKYNVCYYQCSQCQFIFTEPPYWLTEAYGSAITKLDIGLVQRNQLMVPIVRAVINKWFDPQGRFVDYGGGYGMLVRMMRDQGFDFYRQDTHCANLHANSFDIDDIPPFKAELLTAFEVFEHLIDPVSELEKMLTLGNAILFSTTIQPTENVKPESWWYFIPETGQHLSLYSRKSLYALANRLGLNYNWSGNNLHLLSRKSINNKLFKAIMHPRINELYNLLTGEKKTLLQTDFMNIRERLKNDLLNSVTNGDNLDSI